MAGVYINPYPRFGTALFCLLLVLLPFAATQCEKDRRDLEAPGRAEIEAHLQTDNSIDVKISIPPDSHVYLDRGARGNLIPITFDWQPLIQKGLLKAKPLLAAGPQGIRDKKVEALILRGQGLFRFEGENLKKLLGQDLRVRTQVCDEVQGICYRPVWTPIEIAPSPN